MTTDARGLAQLLKRGSPGAWELHQAGLSPSEALATAVSQSGPPPPPPEGDD